MWNCNTNVPNTYRTWDCSITRYTGLKQYNIALVELSLSKFHLLLLLPLFPSPPLSFLLVLPLFFFFPSFCLFQGCPMHFRLLHSLADYVFSAQEQRPDVGHVPWRSPTLASAHVSCTRYVLISIGLRLISSWFDPFSGVCIRVRDAGVMLWNFSSENSFSMRICEKTNPNMNNGIIPACLNRKTHYERRWWIGSIKKIDTDDHDEIPFPFRSY